MDIPVTAKSKPTLLFIIDHIYATTGGTENQLLHIINNLAKRKNYDLHLLLLNKTPWLLQNQSTLNCTTKAFDYNVFNHKDPRNILSFCKMILYIKKVAPDAVMTFFKTSYILGVLAARIAGVKNNISTRRDYGLWLDSKSIPLLKWSNRYVKRIITNSHTVKTLTVEKEHYDSSKIEVIYNGIDCAAYRVKKPAKHPLKEKLGIPGNAAVVGIVAGLRPMKHHRTFIKAARIVLKEYNNTVFLIVGDGPLGKELKALTEELGIENAFYFAGWQEDIIPYLSLFDLGINCSANEGLSNAIMEYMAFGIPCIVSNAGGNPELVQNNVNGYIFTLGNHEELARYIIDLLHDHEKQSYFINQSKIKINELSIDKMIYHYDQFFTQLLSQH